MINKKKNLEEIIKLARGKEDIKSAFIKRLKEGAPTRDENPRSHFCVYFAAYDPENQQVFIGHHKKSGLWLFNGGHIDEGEIPTEALSREIKEEWGESVKLQKNYKPMLLTITKINNPTKQTCRLHYDIWYFIPFDKNLFRPDKKLLETEFYENDWKSAIEAKKFIIEKNTLYALEKMEELFR